MLSDERDTDDATPCAADERLSAERYDIAERRRADVPMLMRRRR